MTYTSKYIIFKYAFTNTSFVSLSPIHRQGGGEGGGEGSGAWLRNRHLTAKSRLPVFAALGCGLALTGDLTGNSTGHLTGSGSLTGDVTVTAGNHNHNINHIATATHSDNNNNVGNSNNSNNSVALHSTMRPQSHNTTTATASPHRLSTPPPPLSTPPQTISTPLPPHFHEMHTLDLALDPALDPALDSALNLDSIHLMDSMLPTLPPTSLRTSGWSDIWGDTIPLGQGKDGANAAVNTISLPVPPTTSMSIGRYSYPTSSHTYTYSYNEYISNINESDTGHISHITITPLKHSPFPPFPFVNL